MDNLEVEENEKKMNWIFAIKFEFAIERRNTIGAQVLNIASREI